MIQGFDFGLDLSGELLLDEDDNLDILKKTENDLRLQLSYDRIKSVSTNWFEDHIGADLESIIGRPCDTSTADVGKNLIDKQLTFDDLWDEDEYLIKAKIKNDFTIEYNIFFKIKDEEADEVYSYEIDAIIDLIKGVHIRYGWRPRKNDSIKH